MMSFGCVPATPNVRPARNKERGAWWQKHLLALGCSICCQVGCLQCAQSLAAIGFLAFGLGGYWVIY